MKTDMTATSHMAVMRESRLCSTDLQLLKLEWKNSTTLMSRPLEGKLRSGLKRVGL